MPKNATVKPHTKRAAERTALQEAKCEHGSIADVSSTGMQVCCDGAAPVGLNEPVVFTVSSVDKKVSVEGHVVWVKRPGVVFGPSRFGVRFIEPGGVAAQALVHLAQIGVWPEKLETPKAKRGPAATNGKSKPKDAPASNRVQIQVLDLYAMLNIGPDADEDTIRSAYRKQVRQWHPDRCEQPDASIRLEMVVGAGRVLMDAQSRREYDLRRAG